MMVSLEKRFEKVRKLKEGREVENFANVKDPGADVLFLSDGEIRIRFLFWQKGNAGKVERE